MDTSIRVARLDELEALVAIDDEASSLYAEHGLAIELAPEHPFARAERTRWLRSTQLGRSFVAVDASDAPLAFAALDIVDGVPYLDQLAVRPASMRRGLGSRLLTQAAEWAQNMGGSELWLTTYAHLSFNRPYYERHGYTTVSESLWGPGIRHHVAEQRLHLPAPTQRIAMRRTL